MSTVAEYLAGSKAAHQDYQRNIPHKEAQGATLVTIMGNPTQARASLQSAYDQRLQADKLDPAHQDPAWLMDPIAHRDLIAFYEKELAK